MPRIIKLELLSISSLNQINSGIYLLELFAEHSFQISTSKFQGIKFKAGWYYYVGSAQKGLHKRITRHIKKRKKIHWHIDHLTTLKMINIKRVFILRNGLKSDETKLANIISKIDHINDSISGFGNSDTKDTRTHLFFSDVPIDHNHLFSLYQSMVCFIPSSNETF